MNLKNLLNKVLSIVLPLGMMMGSICLFSCEETDEVGEYAQWKALNVEFVDSIAEVAKTNADGKWMRLLSYKLDSIDINGIYVEHDTEDYIYCHIEEQGTGTERPMATDVVSVNYRGRLMPTSTYPQGMIFDESYKGAFNPHTSMSKNFKVDDLVVGWITALVHMNTGDRWKVYIPANLGYGSQEKGEIPAYSALVFEVNLVDVID